MTNLKEEHTEALWERAKRSGIDRRKFLTLLAASGATAVLASCAPKVMPSIPPAPITPAPAPSPAPTRLIDKPVPSQFFDPISASNFEMRFEEMANREYVMPNSLFFVRNHTSTPIVDIKTWKLSIAGDGVTKPYDISYNDLLKLPAKKVTRYIECAGNGRSFFDSLLKKPAQGGQWHFGAYGIAEWTGVQLSEILGRAGIKREAVDIMPIGLDDTQVQRPLPVSKAMEDDTMLVYMMNGDLLPLDHGFPSRIVVPGWVGISSIKWVGKINVSTTPLYSDKNTTSYVLVGPDYQPQPPAKGPAVTTQVMKSALCLPWPAVLSSGQQKLIGYAWSPLGKIAKVDVSIDGGRTFQNATLTGPNIERAGSRWEFSFTAKPGDMTIIPRATDEKGNVQNDISQQKWNEMGYIFGAMVPHPVTVK